MKKKYLYILGGAFAFFFILGIIFDPSKEERAEAAKVKRERIVKDSLAQEAEKAKVVAKAEAEALAFSKLPKKEQERILAERRRKEKELKLEKILEKEENRVLMQLTAEDAVKNRLKSPGSYEKTAVAEPQIDINGFNVVVMYTALNAFGVRLQSTAIVSFDEFGKVTGIKD